MEITVTLRQEGTSRYGTFVLPVSEREVRRSFFLGDDPDLYYLVAESDYDLIPEPMSISDMNAFAEMVENIDEDVVCAVRELTGYNASDFLRYDFSFEDVTLLTDVYTQRELGHHYADEVELSRETLERYFDYEAYGRDIDIESRGGFSSYGFVDYP